MIKRQQFLLKNRIILFCSVALICMLGFSGCNKEQPPAPPVQQAKVVPPQPKPVQKPVSSVQKNALPKPAQAPPTPTAQPPVQSLTQTVVPPSANPFDFSNKKDPFKPFVKAAPVKPVEETKKSIKDDTLPIYSLDLEKFTLIGIITGGKQNQAMVIDPGKKGYVLKVGMKIGNKDGIVKSITATKVEVVEKEKDDSSGKVKDNIRTLILPRKQ